MPFCRDAFVLFWTNATVENALLCCVYTPPPHPPTPESCATYIVQPAVVCILSTHCLLLENCREVQEALIIVNEKDLEVEGHPKKTSYILWILCLCTLFTVKFQEAPITESCNLTTSACSSCVFVASLFLELICINLNS